MIGISKLYCQSIEPSDPLRYSRHSSKLPSHLLQFSEDKKPVVVWNLTRKCNLKCVHCYSHSTLNFPAEEILPENELQIIDDLADFGIPVLLFSGGEPLMHPRIFDLISYARRKGIRAVLSTNGTLITKEVAAELKEFGLSYVGISIDGLEPTHNKFRGVDGSFEAAMTGIKNCQDEGLKVGLRFTVNKRNHKDIPGIFDLLRERQVPRICFYHLAYSGRGTGMVEDALSNEETREVIDLIVSRTLELHEEGFKAEVLTVNNHCDGVYLYLKALKENPGKADDILKLLKMNGGNNTGVGIGCISWNGDLHPDQFWRGHKLGNVIETSFGSIWSNPDHDFLAPLRERKKHLKGRCAKCKWLDVCNGNSRARAEAVYGDIWAQEPACYLTDKEIGI